MFPLPEISPPPSCIPLLRDTIAAHGADLVARFYDVLLEDDEAQAFLSHSVVHNRLSASLGKWLAALLDEADIRHSQDLRDQQKVIGEVHARIKVPIHLVMQGGIVIKQHLSDLLAASAPDTATAMRAAQLANARIDTAIMLMSQAYVNDATARARLDEAYRLFSIDQDVATEKEAQKASLMEWSQKTLFSLLRGQAQGGLDRLANSPFGLWIRHRAEFMFERSGAFQELLAETHKIDRLLLPELEDSGQSNRRIAALTDLQAAVDRVAFLLGELFHTLTALENGRDPLTRALNRRFLPAILGREISFANANGTPLCIVLLDVDHFKAINDRHGHQTGDLVLRQVAQVIMEHVRPSDFVFRYGGEEFLIVLTETRLAEGQAVAERIRHALAASRLETGGSDTLSLTASFGLAAHGGHPDQQYLLKAADEALYRAKAAGRDRVELADV